MNYYKEDSWAQEEAEARAEYERTFHLVDELKQKLEEKDKKLQVTNQENAALKQKYSDLD